MTDRNLTMLTDFYEFTMANGYLKNGLADRIAYFDMFFRRIPDKGATLSLPVLSSCAII